MRSLLRSSASHSCAAVIDSNFSKAMNPPSDRAVSARHNVQHTHTAAQLWMGYLGSFRPAAGPYNISVLRYQCSRQTNDNFWKAEEPLHSIPTALHTLLVKPWVTPKHPLWSASTATSLVYNFAESGTFRATGTLIDLLYPQHTLVAPQQPASTSRKLLRALGAWTTLCARYTIASAISHPLSQAYTWHMITPVNAVDDTTKAYHGFVSIFEKIIEAKGTRGLFIEGLDAHIGSNIASSVVNYMVSRGLQQLLFPNAAAEQAEIAQLLSLARTNAETNAALRRQWNFQLRLNSIYVVASVLTKLLVFPLYTVRYQLESQGHRLIMAAGTVEKYTNALECFRRIVAKDGMWGLYRGWATQAASLVPEMAWQLIMWLIGKGIMFFALTDDDDEEEEDEEYDEEHEKAVYEQWHREYAAVIGRNTTAIAWDHVRVGFAAARSEHTPTIRVEVQQDDRQDEVRIIRQMESDEIEREDEAVGATGVANGITDAMLAGEGETTVVGTIARGDTEKVEENRD